VSILEKGTLIFSIAFYEKAITPDAIFDFIENRFAPGVAYVLRGPTIGPPWAHGTFKPLVLLGF
jgi:hypothetical protein